MDGKEEEFYNNFPDINDLTIRPFVTTKDAETYQRYGFSDYFRDLLFGNVHVITNWPKPLHDTSYVFVCLGLKRAE